MKTSAIIAAMTITIGIGTTSLAQQYAAKAYLNVSNSNFKSYIYTRYQNQNTRGYLKDYIYPSIAVNYKNKKKNQHEIELNKVNISSTDLYIENLNAGSNIYFRSQQLTTTQIHLRYEYILSFIKRRSVIFEHSVGFGELTYYERVKATPYESSNFPTSATYFGTRFTITPRVSINISKRVFADANIPFCILDAGIAKQHIANPTLPVQAQNYSIADVDVFPKYYSFRLGAGLRF